MKISSSFAKTLAMAGFIGVAAVTTQAQSVISWSYDVYGFTLATGNNGGQWVPNTTAGVVPADHWNDVWNENGTQWPNPARTVNNLWDNAGNNSGVSLTYQANDTWQINTSHKGIDADGTYNRELLNGYVDSGSPSSSTIAISAIPYSIYNLIVYISSDTAGRAGTVNVGSDTYYFTTMGPAATSGANALFTQITDTTGSSPTANANYVIFSGLTGSSETITSLVTGGGGIAGFQVVATPEPSSMALAVMGGFGVLLMKRRFKKS